jgi:hypothetical protein
MPWLKVKEIPSTLINTHHFLGHCLVISIDEFALPPSFRDGNKGESRRLSEFFNGKRPQPANRCRVKV